MLKETILGAAVSLARTKGIDRYTRIDVATEAETASANVTYHYGSMDTLRKCVMVYAIQHRILPIIAQGVVAKDPMALGVPLELRTEAVLALV